MGEHDRRSEDQFRAQHRGARSASGSTIERGLLSSRGGRAWEWEAEELRAHERDELEALRLQRKALVAQLAETQASVEAANRHAEALRNALRRLADARWFRRRALARELRDGGLLDE